MRASESKQLGKKNKGLHCRILGLELVLKDKGDEISNLVNKFGKREVRFTSRVEDLKLQVSNLQQETDYRHAQNVELVGNVEGKRNEEVQHFKGLMGKYEVASLQGEKKDLESQLQKKTEEILVTQMRLKHLEDEIEERVKADLKIQEEKKDLLTKVEELELEVNHLQKERYEFNDQIKSKIMEIDQLREENQMLHTRIAELDSSQMEKEIKLVKEQDDIISRLSSKIKDQQKLVKEQKDTIDKVLEDQKLLKPWLFGSTREAKLNHNLLEKKMEELAEDFRMKMEDHIRILYRRIQVAEQIHLESKNNHIKTQEHKGKRESKRDFTFCETHFKKTMDMLERGLIGSETVEKKLEEAEEHTTRVIRFANEINAARTWVREKNEEVEQMKYEVETLVTKLECNETQESLLKEKLSKLEEKLAEEGLEKQSLAKGLSKFGKRIKGLEMDVKEKEVELVRLGEEKMDAIRQLCVLIDYQRGRYDDLKRLIFKVVPKSS